MQQQFFFYADLPNNPKRLERFEPFFLSGSRYSLNAPGFYANIYDTAGDRLVWEDEFATDEHARTAMCVEQLLLARLAARPQHSQ